MNFYLLYINFLTSPPEKNNKKEKQTNNNNKKSPKPTQLRTSKTEYYVGLRKMGESTDMQFGQSSMYCAIKLTDL